MRTLRIAFGLILLVGVLALSSATAALAAQEFSKVGSSVKLTGEETIFDLEGAFVRCADSVGTGKISSVKTTAVEMKYSECMADLGSSEEEVKASVSACHLSLRTDETAIIEEGCTVEASGCVVKIASPGTALERVGYINPEGTFETEITIALSSIVSTVNATCEKLGVTSGKEGTQGGIFTANGLAVNQRHKIEVAGAEEGMAKELVMASKTGTEQEYAFTGTTVAIKCEKFKVEKTTTAEKGQTREFAPPSFAKCFGNLTGSRMEVTMTASLGCNYIVFVFGGPETNPGPYNGGMGWDSNPSEKCEVVARVGSTCAVTFAEFARSLAELKNETGKVEVKEETSPRSAIGYTRNRGGSCMVPPDGTAIAKGTDILEAKNNTNVKIAP
jgi:hypothetical protein